MLDNYVIQVETLTKNYRQNWLRHRVIEALRNVSFGVRRGEIFGLLGPNGAGKTTMVKVLLGIVRKTVGSASLMGYHTGSRKARRHVGYLPEQLRIAPHHTANTALAYYARLSGMSTLLIKQRIEPILDRVGLDDCHRLSVKNYSKGMIQRLGLAQALLHNPQLLILDEPTDGLDPIGRSKVRTILNELREEGCTVFLNSHLLQEVELICDRVAILNRGTLRFVGTIGEATAKMEATRQLHVVIELQGTESVIRKAFATRNLTNWSEIHSNRYSLTVRMEDQKDVDGLVDALRRRGLSIINLAPKRASLEEAFLEMLVDGPVTDKSVL